MGRCSGSHAPGLVVRAQMATALRALGLAPGDVVMLHAAVSAIGWIVGGPDQVLHAIFEVIGETGTLLMYVGWDGSPYDVTLGLPELPPQLAAVWPPFDPATAHAVPEWGILAERLLGWPGVARSAHPDSSFAAVGARAEELVRDHALQYGMGEASPLARLCEVGGKVLLLGSPLSNVTLLHHAEHLADVQDKSVIHYWAPILQNSEPSWVRIEEFDTGSAGCLPWFEEKDMFEAIIEDYVQEGRGAIAPVGGARSYLLDASDLVHFAVTWIEERFAEPVEREVDVEVILADQAHHQDVVALLDAMDAETPGASVSGRRLATRVDEFLEDPNRRVFVAEAGGSPVGILVALRHSQERGILEHAYVDVEYRRRGILREMEIEAAGFLLNEGCRTIQVHVDVDNEPARQAWRDLGYAPSQEFLERPL